MSDDTCDDCKFPSVAKQAANLSTSVFNVLTQALKTGKLVASEEVVEERLKTCEGCPFKQNTRCTQCGCFIALKAGLAAETCPKGKWKK